jgi:gliding motility-associated-like protein
LNDTITLTGLAAGLSITNLSITDPATGCSASSIQNIVIQNPTGPTVTFPNPAPLCINAPVQTLNAGIPAGGRYTIDGNTVTTITPAALGAGIHTIQYQYTDANNCSDSIAGTLTINPLPDATISGEQNVCPQLQNVTYATNYNTTNQYLWNVTGGTYNQGNNPAQILVNWNSTTSGTVQLSVVNTLSQCTDTGLISVRFADAESPVITNCLNEYHVIASRDDAGTYYIFSTPDSICIPKATDRCNQNLNITFSANNSAAHGLPEFTGFRLNKADQNNIRWMITDNAGNTAECSVNIIFELEKAAPTAFSPNADHHNDEWEIDFLTDYPECVVQVYNRWGMLVYESAKGYPVNWDGRVHGRLVPVDTYYYIINLGKNEKAIKGYVTVVY